MSSAATEHEPVESTWLECAFCPPGDNRWPAPVDVEFDIHGFREEYQGAPVRVHLRDRRGADPAEWPLVLRVRQFPQSDRW